ncbi:MAG: hypothetical protein KDI68_09340 [Gammaproteobacteria bacterium]|nr:hypothetical protein [Gammaproteobacteria bacterium]
MTRFITPRYFTEPQSQAVEQSLKRLSIGDPEGIRVFIIALEYELAEYEKLPQEDVTETVVSATTPAPELARIADLAEQTATALTGLAGEARAALLLQLSTSDRFGRRHDDAYVGAVSAELLRIAEACGSSTLPVPAPTENDRLRPADEHFIRTLAEAYYECFETLADDNGGEPFYSLLQDIFEISDLRINLDLERLQGLLH